MIEYLSDLRLFREISRTFSFRQAGEKLGYSPAAVSMRMAVPQSCSMDTG